MKTHKIIAFSMLLAGIANQAHADLTLAHVAPISGPVAIEAREYNLGIRLALAAANAAGGIHGQKLVLRSEDDEYTPDKSVALFDRVGSSDTLAALLPIGSPSLTKVLQEKVLDKHKLPVVGAIPGAEPLRTPLTPYLYHVRAGDLDQYRKLVEHALTTGLQRIAVVYADIPFGQAGVTAIERILGEQQKRLVIKQAIPVGGQPDFNGVLNALAEARADITVVITPAKRAGEFVQAYRNRGLLGILAMPSYGNAETICQIAGEDKARGVILAQVMPNLRNAALPLIRRYREDLRQHGEKDQKPSLFQFEAYATTQVLLEGIKRAGPNPNREKLISALDGLSKLDLGGLSVSFSNTRHTGSSQVDTSIIGRDCQLLY